MINFFKNYLVITVFFLTIIIIYTYNLPNAFLLTTDFGRDMYHSLRITQADLVLIGPKMNFGGYYAGPYFYYLLAPVLLLSNYSIGAVLYSHAILFSIAVSFLYITISKKIGVWQATLACLTIVLLPFFVLSARHPSNGYTYFPFLLIFATLVFFYSYRSKIAIFLLGVLAGIIVNIHPASIFPTFFISCYLLYCIKVKKTFFYFLFGALITFLPLVAFEIKHGFIMTRDTFINNSLSSYINSPNKPQLALHSNKLISISFYLLDKFKEFTNFNFIGFLVLPFLVIAYQLKTLKEKRKGIFKQNVFLFICLILSLSLLFPLMFFHYENHYLFGVMFFISFASVLIILNSHFFYVLAIFVLINIFYFPIGLYKDSDGLVEKIDQAVKYSIEKKLVNKDRGFNLIRVADAYAKVPTGFEYRFFFRKYGFYPNSEYDYRSAGTLLIFAETPFYDIDKFKMWATEEFGREYFKDRGVFKMENIIIYKISK
ncbi:hypothetical protein HYW42_02325 [Candidatus Daviesbacteria bacterium]|nr:hypothetical protein [Candidatus Daviesbacteria bacterium]